MLEVTNTEAEWLAVRREGIGASEWAAILGVDPRKGPLAVYAEKLGYQQEDAMVLRRGRRLEPVIADEYATETGRPVVNPGAHSVARSSLLPYLTATLDRLTAGSTKTPGPVPDPALVPLELKALLGPHYRSEWEDDGSPVWYEIQLQAQMFVTGAEWGSLGGLVGLSEPIAVRDHRRNDAFISAALPRLEEFWLRVQRRQPPPADGLPGTTEAVRKLWGRENGQTVALEPGALALVEAWERASLGKARAIQERDRLDNDIRALLGNATFGALADGSFVTLRTVEKAEHIVHATKYRQVRRYWPKLPRRRS